MGLNNVMGLNLDVTLESFGVKIRHEPRTMKLVGMTYKQLSMQPQYTKYDI